MHDNNLSNNIQRVPPSWVLSLSFLLSVPWPLPPMVSRWSEPYLFTFFSVSQGVPPSAAFICTLSHFLSIPWCPLQAFFLCCNTSLGGLQRWVPFTRAHPFPFSTGPSLFWFQFISIPHEVTSFWCPNVSVPLQSPEVSILHWFTSFPCPDIFSLCMPSSWGPLALFPTQWVLAHPFAAVHWSHHAAAFALPPCSTIHSGPQCLRCCNGGFISPTSRSDTGRVLGHGKCSTHDLQHFPSSMWVNAQGSAPLCICAGLHSCASLALSFDPQCSPHADLFSSCAGASIGCTSLHCHHDTITHCHCISPPQQCNLSCHHCHHCGHQNQGAMYWKLASPQLMSGRQNYIV